MIIKYLISALIVGFAIGLILFGIDSFVDFIIDKAFDNNPALAVGFVIFILLCGILVKFKSIFKYYKKSEENKKTNTR